MKDGTREALVAMVGEAFVAAFDARVRAIVAETAGGSGPSGQSAGNGVAPQAVTSPSAEAGPDMWIGKVWWPSDEQPEHRRAWPADASFPNFRIHYVDARKLAALEEEVGRLRAERDDTAAALRDSRRIRADDLAYLARVDAARDAAEKRAAAAEDALASYPPRSAVGSGTHWVQQEELERERAAHAATRRELEEARGRQATLADTAERMTKAARDAIVTRQRSEARETRLREDTRAAYAHAVALASALRLAVTTEFPKERLATLASWEAYVLSLSPAPPADDCGCGMYTVCEEHAKAKAPETRTEGKP